MLFSATFTTIFVTANHLYSTFASPTVSKSDGAIGQSLNQTHSLAKRVFTPMDQKCREPEDWNLRRCVTGSGDRAWEDQCINHDVVEYYVPGTCPEDTMCMNILSPEPEAALTIACVGPPNEKSQSNSEPNSQTGVISILNSTYGNGSPINRTISIPLVKAIPEASVSAFMEGTDGNYVVAANAAITGSVTRGTTVNLCVYNEINRDCVPTIHSGLSSTDSIDFAFGMYDNQAVRFYYGIFGKKVS